MDSKLNNFLNDKGQLTAFPAKRKLKMHALLYLAGKFEQGRVYTEKEVNALLGEWHTFGDPATLRRELYDARFLDREPSGRSYWLEEKQPTVDDIERKYG